MPWSCREEWIYRPMFSWPWNYLQVSCQFYAPAALAHQDLNSVVQPEASCYTDCTVLAPGETEVLRENQCHCHMSHDLIWDWTQVTTVGKQQLTVSIFSSKTSREGRGKREEWGGTERDTLCVCACSFLLHRPMGLSLSSETEKALTCNL
jgi:hypothetical protein